MADKNWKRHERATAARLGGKRTPINGRGCEADVAHTWLAIECKSKRTLPAWLRTALKQAKQAAGTALKLPVAVLHQEHTAHKTDLVVIQMSDFQDWFLGETVVEDHAGYSGLLTEGPSDGKT